MNENMKRTIRPHARKVVIRNEQLLTITRAVNRTRDPYDVYICRPGPWRNPFISPRDGTRTEVLDKFEAWFLESSHPRAKWMREHIHELKGKRLGCFCAPAMCHGDILAKFAERT